MIGGTRQSVNKLLSGLVDEGLLQIDRDTLVITDLAALEGTKRPITCRRRHRTCREHASRL